MSTVNYFTYLCIKPSQLGNRIYKKFIYVDTSIPIFYLYHCCQFLIVLLLFIVIFEYNNMM